MPGPDTPTHTGAKIVAGKVYVNNGFWDTYRTTWPAYSFLTPSQAGEMVDGFVQQYKDGGWTSAGPPRLRRPDDRHLLGRGVRRRLRQGVRFDAKAAYDATVKNATVVPPMSGVGRRA